MRRLAENTVQLVKELAPIVRDIVLAPIAMVVVIIIKRNLKKSRQKRLQLNK